MPSFPEDVFRPPQDEATKVWRYTDFQKFVSMLVKKGLFFSRLDKLGDQFEGSITRADNEVLSQKYTSVVRRAAQDHTPKYMLPRTFVSCWHMSEHESAAMWDLYGKGGQAIAIQSTYGRLRDWLDKKIDIGKITYIDYDQDRIPEGRFMHQVMHKRKSFEHERELRAVLFDKESKVPTESGIWQKGNLSDLLEDVYTSPTAPDWFRDAVADVSRTYGLAVRVIRSSLDDDPVY